MDIQKIKIFKDRCAIMQHILTLCNQNKINTKKISVSYCLGEPIIFNIFCKEKKFMIKSDVSFKTINCGKCICRIFNYKDFKKELINDNEKYWSMCNNNNIFFDPSYRYKKMIKSAKHRQKLWPIIKKIFY